MAKSARASGIKKNKQALKKRVFGPVESARNERQNAKLIALAKAPREEKMEEADQEETTSSAQNNVKENSTAQDIDMDATTKKTRSKREVKRLQEARAQRQERKSRKKPRNQVAFPTGRGKKGGKR